MSIQRLSPQDSGCYVDSHWGQYASARMIEVAQQFGYSDADAADLSARKLSEMFPRNGEPISDDEHEILSYCTYEAEAWLNENVAPEGYYFGWQEGEFYLWPNDEWEEVL